MSARTAWTKLVNRIRAWTPEDDAVLAERWNTQSHAEIARAIGRTEKAVRSRCSILGFVGKERIWSQKDVAAVLEAYAKVIASDIDLAGVATRLGRTKGAVVQMAAGLGLTDPKRPRIPAEERKVRAPRFATISERRDFQSETRKRVIREQGHPRGMLGKKHSAETKSRLRETSTAAMALRTPAQTAAYALKAMKTRVANGHEITPRENATWKGGWRLIGGFRKYYRSRWEANYARYLEWLRGQGEIKSWTHEPKTFWFEKVKRGAVSYLPDFLVVEKTGREAYHEVKGWMDDRSKVKLQRMARHHPKVRLVVVQKKQYLAIERSVAPLIPGWEL